MYRFTGQHERKKGDKRISTGKFIWRPRKWAGHPGTVQFWILYFRVPKKGMSGLPYFRRPSLTFLDMHIKSKHFSLLFMPGKNFGWGTFDTQNCNVQEWRSLAPTPTSSLSLLPPRFRLAPHSLPILLLRKDESGSSPRSTEDSTAESLALWSAGMLEPSYIWPLMQCCNSLLPTVHYMGFPSVLPC